MNICIFTKGLPVHATGGMEIFTQSLIDGLIKKQHQVTVITTKYPLEIREHIKKNLRLCYVGDKSLRCTGNFYKESLKTFIKLNSEKRFDIVHSISTAGYGLAKSFDPYHIPFVITFQGTALNEIKGAIKTKSIKTIAITLYDMLIVQDDKTLCNRVNKIIVPSYELKEDIKNQYNVHKEEIVVIRNGIDIEKFKPNLDVQKLKEKYNIVKNKVILSVGVMTGQKGQNLLIQIMPEILKFDKDIKLVLGGYGSDMENLKNMSKVLNVSDSVIFTDKIPHEDLQFYYNLCDVFVFPTLRIEAAPLVIEEAMSCGKPVIASRIGGIPTVIENFKDGILIEPNNLKELKDRILEVLGNNNLSLTLGKNARKKIIEQYSTDKMVENTIKIYEKVIKNEYPSILE